MSVYLVDGSHLLHRILHTPLGDFDTRDGRPSGYVHGFLQSLISIRRRSGKGIKYIVAWDKSSSKFRTEIYPQYKEGRYSIITEEDKYRHDRYTSGRKLLIDVLEQLGIPNIQVHGIEGDDIIAFLSRFDLGDRKVVYSDDSDLTMLVKDDTDCYKGMKHQYLTMADYTKELGLHETLYYAEMINILAITGTHNGVPGVKGLGFKTAQKIVKLRLEGEPVPTKGKKFQMYHENIELYKRNLKLIDFFYALDNCPTMRKDIYSVFKTVCSTERSSLTFIQKVAILQDLELYQCIEGLSYLNDSGYRLER